MSVGVAEVVLTAYGTRLVEKVTPLITELRSVFIEEPTLQRGKIILGVSEAILASWAPALFARVRERLPEVEFEFHAQRSPWSWIGFVPGNTWWGSARARRRLIMIWYRKCSAWSPWCLSPLR